MSKKPNTLEVSLKVRNGHGVLLSEHVIRGRQVELINYFPSGQIARKMDVSLDVFITEVEKLRVKEA